jgi:membrane protease subunit (stomatin/prohibitin family)
MIKLEDYKVADEVNFNANYPVKGTVTAVTDDSITIENADEVTETYAADKLTVVGGELPRPEDGNVVMTLDNGSILDTTKETLKVLVDSGEITEIFGVSDAELSVIENLINE